MVNEAFRVKILESGQIVPLGSFRASDMTHIADILYVQNADFIEFLSWHGLCIALGICEWCGSRTRWGDCGTTPFLRKVGPNGTGALWKTQNWWVCHGRSH